ncbi:Gfo/Idh/MocA family protein [Janthinobacterium fluminis]|uniref:Gfo/Idh/MocA family oxidoreductase n=1 Tax=Janthinobacterium fluminis TaxID=2987524 RepID=A0ABT5K542_9BURK|nr:Gfo/Idh/MocA family oxidoreductase [Janthinobacterium fluminis]MDC8758877.1 Gfo/Idh/MocA family oxidoreductase [Janthinobacterium fluminis]
MKKWKIAIVGSGYMAQEHARAFASLAEVEIVGVCGRGRARAEALAATYAVPAFDSIDALYRATAADAVVVAVNELSMQEVSAACFAHPWLCLLEKPVGVDLPQALAIQDGARRAAARAYVALNRRSYASTRQALARLEGDDSARLISVLDQQDMVSAREGGQPEEVVRNYMYANSIHLIDYLNLFGRGAIVGVEPTLRWNPEQPGFVAATVHYASGDKGLYQAVWNGPGPWSVTVSNAQARLELRPLEKLAVQLRGERRLLDVAPEAIDSEFKPGLRHQAEQVVHLLAGRPSMLATLDEATRSMALCADIYGLRPALAA